MNWEALGAIGSLANALAVLSTLVYLAIQVRQNTKQIEENTNAVRASAVHASLNFTFSNRAAVFSDEGTAEIYERGVENIDSLNSTERLRFRLMMNNVFDAYLNMYSQTESTGFSPTTWKAQVFLFKRVLQTNGGTWFWESNREAYPEAFQAEVERIKRAPPNTPLESDT